MPSNNLSHAHLATRATAGPSGANDQVSHARVADTSSRLECKMSPGNEKTWEAAARRDQKRGIHRWQHEGSCAAFAPAGSAGESQAACAGSPWLPLTRAGEPWRAGRSDALCASFPSCCSEHPVHSPLRPSEGSQRSRGPVTAEHHSCSYQGPKKGDANKNGEKHCATNSCSSENSAAGRLPPRARQAGSTR